MFFNVSISAVKYRSGEESSLYISNTIFSEDISNEEWKALSEIF